MSSGDTITGTVAIVAVSIVTIVVAIAIIRCIQKIRMQARNTSAQTRNTAMQATAVSTESRPLNSAVDVDSSIDMVTIECFLKDIVKERPVRFSPQNIIDFTQNFAQKLGSGGFGIVYKGQFPNGVQIAVKILHKTQDKKAEEQFMAEIGTIGRTHHINLVRLFGFCFDKALKALVYEYMEKGSLDGYLFDENLKLKWEKLYEIAIGTAKGIRYLHEECQRRIVHYDIKPGNVLLDANFFPKVADFGLARLCDRDNTHVSMTGGRGTPGYAAPELWMPYPVTHKCDVYSYGMLLFEILGRRRNLILGQAESQEWFPRWIWDKFEGGELESVMLNCGIEHNDRDKAERMCKVALWCVQYQPDARPSMNSIIRMLEGEEEIIAPKNPFQYMMPFDGSSSQWSESRGDSTSTATATNESEENSLIHQNQQ
ncbi:rust resistance kinase Lr10-like [Dioscorea cayenensis subsp. rotundata]|uniref:Rust resistance kinase Lr10-like n=1 Tax=Dioscorea cayennensis subsp. rotundata TaxID=55577 RepID=A0AB40CQP5_DIOCR|nr:rust resistance kinase Lr10-like [Dioscorea cayenensis subsp. rotundata]XP_039141402.1 rust resistance kinase Lr10-like [Dioscorea cayenensis subsp. rotundata]XP_039141403.1 rust resistance kinase Lr10-like [Dioscorea cayenensis subsp. rotundata]XP_039141404.1 rust resistance kinase Lr10-like [Dioscorea cayenensis subsp. rotundata]XP_039141405.1 rust resistance kinase Lr10-like [Dioscorea cayenensis subsp. rotundata]